MTKIKKMLIGVEVIVALLTIVLSFHNPYTDRVNPLISQETRYAQQVKGSKQY